MVHQLTVWVIDSAEMIFEKPLSGEFDEVQFGPDRGNTLWIQFGDSESATVWIGKFGCGQSQAMRVSPARRPGWYFVVAGGFAYVIDATHRTLINHYLSPWIQDVAFDPQAEDFIAADTDLRVIHGGKEVWRSDRISIDWIHSLRIEGRLLHGMAIVGYQDEEAPFVFDLDTRQFIQRPRAP